MELETICMLLHSLAERMQRDEATKKRILVGHVSDKEYAALDAAVRKLGGEPLVSDSTREDEGDRAPRLDLSCLEIKKPEDPDILLCLDFGTAASKACATRSNDSTLLPLAIGQRAGQLDLEYALVSSLFITKDERVLFGANAVAVSMHEVDLDHERLDSLKDILCKEPKVDLDDALLGSNFNPTEIPLSKGDALVLYLAFLTDMATTELQQKYGCSRYVRRRYTLPILDNERWEWAQRQLKRALIRAQIVADTLSGKWEQGISLTEAKRVLRAVNSELKMRSDYETLLDRGVSEPIAAVGSRVRNYVANQSRKELIAIADVGAGTIDFGMFFRVEVPGKESHFWEIPGSQKVLRQAGNRIDDLLLEYILEQSAVRQPQHDYHRIAASLRLDIRRLKERLFVDGSIDYTLQNEKRGLVELSDFLVSSGMTELGQLISQTFEEMLRSLDSSWFTETRISGLPIVFTGGGARLPMLSQLGGQRLIAGRAIDVKTVSSDPRWVAEEYPGLTAEYPRLAVAIGGASRQLPYLGTWTFPEFLGLNVDHVLEVVRKGV